MKTLKPLEIKLRAIIEQAIAQPVATSISLAVSVGDDSEKIVVHGGRTHREKTSDAAIYDLASLTKILGPMLAIAHGIDRGMFQLDDNFFPQWPHASLRALLAHKAGLPEHRRFYEILDLTGEDFSKNKSTVLADLFSIHATENREKRLYSDLGFIALGHILEHKFKKPLFDIYSDAWRTSGLETNFSWYRSKSLSYKNDDPHMVPEGFCEARRHFVLGQVHDPNCYFMGGLEGHAGLFGRLADVDAYGRDFLRAVKTPTSAVDQLIKYFARHSLGFDKPARNGTTRYFSSDAFGHFGYTGTSLWIEPRANLVVTLLSNRVNVSEKPDGIFWLRLSINRAIARHLSLSEMS